MRPLPSFPNATPYVFHRLERRAHWVQGKRRRFPRGVMDAERALT